MTTDEIVPPEGALRTEATAYLRKMSGGDEEAGDRLFELLYADLKRMAAYQLKGERADHTLQPTALVHEAWLKLIAPGELEAESKRHFLLLASQAMRRLLVDYARSRKRVKRGGDHQKVEMPEQIAASGFEDQPLDVEAVHVALERLEKRSPRYARIVELRFFSGLSGDEVAEVMETSRATITRDWRVAKALLTKALKEG